LPQRLPELALKSNRRFMHIVNILKPSN